MWQDNSEVTEYLETAITAKVYCENIILNGYIDWRVPSVNEIINIIDVNEKNAINKKFNYVKANFYSTSSSFKNDSELKLDILKKDIDTLNLDYTGQQFIDKLIQKMNLTFNSNNNRNNKSN